MEGRGWFEVVRDAFYDALCAVFCVDPDEQSSLDRFIPAYVDGVSTPEADRNKDVCYYAISVERGTTEDYVSVENDTDSVIVTKTIPVRVLVTFYGPHADDDSETFWSRIQVDAGYGSARQVLRSYNLVLRGTPDRPLAAPEVEGSVWRRRCDVLVQLAYLDTDTLTARTVEEVPIINIMLAEKAAGKD